MPTPLVYSANERSLRAPFAFPLRAGPVTLEFIDGDLCHLRAGGEELIRRITFNVRHHRWETASWRVDSLRLQQQPDRFFLHFSAACEVAGAPYTWSADIFGEADGTLTYSVIGVAHADSAEFRRAGLNILYANECVLGQPFETTHVDGKVAANTFPERVPAHHLLATDFLKIAHHTRGGATVTAEISGSLFGLEDQRVAGDSTFKAFSALRHTYAPVLKQGDRAEKCVTIQVQNPAAHSVPSTTLATLAAKADGATLPRVETARPQTDYGVFHELTRRPAAKNGIFLDVNLAPDKSHHAKALTWGWYPTINLYDDGAVMDNASSIAGQLLSARRFAPEAHLRIDPIALDSIHPRTVPRDPRNDTPFGAAWLVAATKHLALGGAHEAAFAIDGPYARAAQAVLAAQAGYPLRDACVSAEGARPIEVFALEAPSALFVWLANFTGESQAFTLAGLPAASPLDRRRLHAGTGPEFRDFPAGFTDSDGRIRLCLAPHEVTLLQF